MIDGGIVSPSAVAVLRFTTISNLVGNCTGRSPGFSPRRMRGGDLSLLHGIVFVARDEHADAPHAVALLRACRERPNSRAAEERDELAPPNHSITSVASANTVAGTSRPRAFAVLRLRTSSYFVGAC